MNILIIDDWQSRHDLITYGLSRSGGTFEFEHRFSPEDTHPTDYRWADVLFLDHDMCCAPEGEPCPQPNGHGKGSNCLNKGCGCPTGMDAVRALCAQPTRPHVVVHTGNPTAGIRMSEILHAHGFSVVRSPEPGWDSLLSSTLYKTWRIPGLF